jgi:CRISPR/Cas system-associated protein Csm6
MAVDMKRVTMTTMKTLLAILFFLAAEGHARAGREKSANKNNESGLMRICFSNHITSSAHTDSVLVIFDKYNHTGAGVIKKIYYPGTDHSINVTGVSLGRYYVTIQYLGMHKECIQKVTRIKSGESTVLKIRLQDCEEYSKEAVKIPVERIDVTRLSVTRIL